MKVLLINPRDLHMHEVRQKCYPPLNLLYLAAALREARVDVQVMDANAFGLSDADILARTCDAAPDLVGMPLLAETAPQVHAITAAIHEARPHTAVVLGGPTASAWPEWALEGFPGVDYVIRGEGEDALVSLCQVLAGRMSPPDVPGLSWREGGELKHNDTAPPKRDADAFPFPARDLIADAYDTKRYYTLLVRERPTDTITTTRGCPFGCKFCYNTSRSYRKRSRENVMEELAAIYARGIRHVEFVDDNFTLDRKHAAAILEAIIQEGMKLQIVIKSRVNAVDPELLALMKGAGVYQISYGTESGSQRMLDLMGKGTTVEDNERANRITKEAGINSHTSWFFGYPGETPETIQETIDFICRIRPTTANFGVFRPYPATPVYDEVKEAGTMIGDWRPDTGEVPWVKLPWTESRADLERWVRVAQRRLYFRPYYAYHFTKHILKNANWTMALYAWQEAKKAAGMG